MLRVGKWFMHVSFHHRTFRKWDNYMTWRWMKFNRKLCQGQMAFQCTTVNGIMLAAADIVISIKRCLFNVLDPMHAPWPRPSWEKHNNIIWWHTWKILRFKVVDTNVFQTPEFSACLYRQVAIFSQKFIWNVKIDKSQHIAD